MIIYITTYNKLISAKMLKGEVSVCGTILNSALEKTAQNGNKFIAFTVVVPLQGKDESVAEVRVQVSAPGDKKTAAKYPSGKHVSFTGHLNVRKVDGKEYYNVRCDEVPEIVKISDDDKLEGHLEFTGCIDNNGVARKKDKKGREYHIFEAWSMDKGKDPSAKAQFIYVHFINFHPKDDTPTKPHTYITASGPLEFHVWKGKASIQCQVEEVKERVFPKDGDTSSADNQH